MPASAGKEVGRLRTCFGLANRIDEKRAIAYDVRVFFSCER